MEGGWREDEEREGGREDRGRGRWKEGLDGGRCQSVYAVVQAHNADVPLAAAVYLIV